ncbi:MAG: hypothetical protein RL238_1750 [Actinomycetota bacterium]|jgi:hypothetical protein
MIRSLAVHWLLAAPVPVDPGVLDTVAQDPDDVREQACRIVEASPGVCSPPTTTIAKPSGGGFDLSFLGVLFWVLLFVGVVLLLVALMRALDRRSPTRRRTKKKAASDTVDDELETGFVQIDRSREPTDWRSEAEGHRRAGRYRDALRCRYRALVGDLARRGLIDEIPGRTTGEERAQLRVVRPGAGEPFDAAADLFDDAWYGHAEVGADDDDRFQALERDVLAGVQR